MRYLVLVFALLFGAQAYAESIAVPIAIYGGANAADLASTRYLQSRGGHETWLAGDSLTAQVALKVAATTGEIYIDRKILSKNKTVCWIVRVVFVSAYAVVVAHNIQVAVEL